MYLTVANDKGGHEAAKTDRPITVRNMWKSKSSIRSTMHFNVAFPVGL